jgi:hypothetical protein
LVTQFSVGVLGRPPVFCRDGLWFFPLCLASLGRKPIQLAPHAAAICHLSLSLCTPSPPRSHAAWRGAARIFRTAVQHRLDLGSGNVRGNVHFSNGSFWNCLDVRSGIVRWILMGAWVRNMDTG